MRKMKKILSLVLVAMMVLSSSLMNTRVVFAEEGEGGEGTPTGVAKVWMNGDGSTEEYYATIDEAIDAVNNAEGDVDLEICADVQTDKKITYLKDSWTSLSIQLNGHTLTVKGGIEVKEVSLNIRNSEGTGILNVSQITMENGYLQMNDIQFSGSITTNGCGVNLDNVQFMTMNPSSVIPDWEAPKHIITQEGDTYRVMHVRYDFMVGDEKVKDIDHYDMFEWDPSNLEIEKVVTRDGRTLYLSGVGQNGSVYTLEFASETSDGNTAPTGLPSGTKAILKDEDGKVTVTLYTKVYTMEVQTNGDHWYNEIPGMAAKHIFVGDDWQYARLSLGEDYYVPMMETEEGGKTVVPVQVTDTYIFEKVAAEAIEADEAAKNFQVLPGEYNWTIAENADGTLAVAIIRDEGNPEGPGPQVPSHETGASVTIDGEEHYYENVSEAIEYLNHLPEDKAGADVWFYLYENAAYDGGINVAKQGNWLHINLNGHSLSLTSGIRFSGCEFMLENGDLVGSITAADDQNHQVQFRNGSLEGNLNPKETLRIDEISNFRFKGIDPQARLEEWNRDKYIFGVTEDGWTIVTKKTYTLHAANEAETEERDEELNDLNNSYRTWNDDRNVVSKLTVFDGRELYISDIKTYGDGTSMEVTFTADGNPERTVVIPWAHHFGLYEREGIDGYVLVTAKAAEIEYVPDWSPDGQSDHILLDIPSVKETPVTTQWSYALKLNDAYYAPVDENGNAITDGSCAFDKAGTYTFIKTTEKSEFRMAGGDFFIQVASAAAEDAEKNALEVTFSYADGRRDGGISIRRGWDSDPVDFETFEEAMAYAAEIHSGNLIIEVWEDVDSEAGVTLYGENDSGFPVNLYLNNHTLKLDGEVNLTRNCDLFINDGTIKAVLKAEGDSRGHFNNVSFEGTTNKPIDCNGVVTYYGSDVYTVLNKELKGMYLIEPIDGGFRIIRKTYSIVCENDNNPETVDSLNVYYREWWRPDYAKVQKIVDYEGNEFYLTSVEPSGASLRMLFTSQEDAGQVQSIPQGYHYGLKKVSGGFELIAAPTIKVLVQSNGGFNWDTEVMLDNPEQGHIMNSSDSIGIVYGNTHYAPVDEDGKPVTNIVLYGKYRLVPTGEDDIRFTPMDSSMAYFTSEGEDLYMTVSYYEWSLKEDPDPEIDLSKTSGATLVIDNESKKTTWYETVEEALDALTATMDQYETAFLYIHGSNQTITYDKPFAIEDQKDDKDRHVLTIELNGNTLNMMGTLTLENSPVIVRNGSFYTEDLHVNTTSMNPSAWQDSDYGMLYLKGTAWSGNMQLTGRNAGQRFGQNATTNAFLRVAGDSVANGQVEASYAMVEMNGGILLGSIAPERTVFKLTRGEFRSTITSLREENAIFEYKYAYIYSFDPEKTRNIWGHHKQTSFIPVIDGEGNEGILAKEVSFNLIDAEDNATVKVISTRYPISSVLGEEETEGLRFALIRDGFGSVYGYVGENEQGEVVFEKSAAPVGSAFIAADKGFSFEEISEDQIVLHQSDIVMILTWNRENPNSVNVVRVPLDGSEQEAIFQSAYMFMSNGVYYSITDMEGKVPDISYEHYSGEYLLHPTQDQPRYQAEINYGYPATISAEKVTVDGEECIKLTFSAIGQEEDCDHVYNYNEDFCVKCGHKIAAAIEMFDGHEGMYGFDTLEEALDALSQTDQREANLLLYQDATVNDSWKLGNTTNDQDYRIIGINLNGHTMEVTGGIEVYNKVISISQGMTDEIGTLAADVHMIIADPVPDEMGEPLSIGYSIVEGNILIEVTENDGQSRMPEIYINNTTVLGNVEANDVLLWIGDDSLIDGDIVVDQSLLVLNGVTVMGNVELKGNSIPDVGTAVFYTWDPTEKVDGSKKIESLTDGGGTPYWLVRSYGFRVLDVQGDVVLGSTELLYDEGFVNVGTSELTVASLKREDDTLYYFKEIVEGEDVKYIFTQENQGQTAVLPENRSVLVRIEYLEDGTEAAVMYVMQVFTVDSIDPNAPEDEEEWYSEIFAIYEEGSGVYIPGWRQSSWSAIHMGDQYYAVVDQKGNTLGNNLMLQGTYRLVEVASKEEAQVRILGGNGHVWIEQDESGYVMEWKYTMDDEHHNCADFLDRFTGTCGVCGTAYQAYMECVGGMGMSWAFKNVEDAVDFFNQDTQQNSYWMQICGEQEVVEVGAFTIDGGDNDTAKADRFLSINSGDNILKVVNEDGSRGTITVRNVELQLDNSIIDSNIMVVTDLYSPLTWDRNGRVSVMSSTIHGDMDFYGLPLNEHSGMDGSKAYLFLRDQSVVDGNINKDPEAKLADISISDGSIVTGDIRKNYSMLQLWNGILQGDLEMVQEDGSWVINYMIFNTFDPTTLPDAEQRFDNDNLTVITQYVGEKPMWIVRPVADEGASYLPEDVRAAIYDALLNRAITLASASLNSALNIDASLANNTTIADVVAQQGNAVQITSGNSGGDPKETMLHSITYSVDEAVAALIDASSDLTITDDGTMEVADGGTIEVSQQIDMNITLRDVNSVMDDESGTFTVNGLVYDIDPVVTTEATYTDAQGNETKVSGVEEVKELTQSITISLVIPKAMGQSVGAGGTMMVVHNHEDNMYIYQAVVSYDAANDIYLATFTDYIGFSQFELVENLTTILLETEDENGDTAYVPVSQMEEVTMDPGTQMTLKVTTESILNGEDEFEDIFIGVDTSNGEVIKVTATEDGIITLSAQNVNGAATILIVAVKGDDLISAAEFIVRIGEEEPGTDPDDPDNPDNPGGDDSGNTPGGDDSGDNSGTPGGDNPGSGDNSNTGNDSGNGNNSGNNSSNGGTDSGSNNNSSSSNGSGENSGANNSGSDNTGSNDSKPTEENNGTNNGSTGEEFSNGTTNTTTNNSKTPDTGDRNNMTVWVMCLLISMVGLVIAVKYGKKRTN